MIVLDTNVVSELMRQVPDDTVVRWVDRYPADEVFITAVTVAELVYGVARLPGGHRKTVLAAKVFELLTEDLQGQVLPFDGASAEYYGEIVAARERQGRPISMADAQIAAVCRRFTACLATRNTKDFVGTGISLLDPWDAATT
ncbi:type II toxin-antitoxin system VapC family toxin [Allokutzneria sp. A3M-2-11 16]|uniref:type II toxin-antitoxin system VapC family toxin n=1 Tax=Allokutzneria sp. A3M-2-11 16 TaxID=2962043 RepID=UPI0020B72E05|nr:type II toxin-antitoxin system VapC family toxin [Allokutzneria sp. A3M-2-11 16]MCP3797930.1 type II toxin-antitoxin system VapC family toxin [Allokutzneria sp. A3M-2-11 16]